MVESSQDTNNEHFMNLYFCGDDYSDLLPFPKEKLTFNDGSYYQDDQLSWNFYCYEGMDQAKVKSIKDLIMDKIDMKIEKQLNNTIICIIQNLNQAKCLFAGLNDIAPKDLKPIFVFISKQPDITQNALRDLIKAKNSGYNFDIRLVYKEKHTVNDLMTRLLKICSYYNQLGDTYHFPYQLENGSNTLVESVFPFNINIMIIGSPGCGKSTFINKVFAEQRSLVRQGRSVTNKITPYHHKKYPIKLHDTPGFETAEDQDKLIKKIEEHYDETVAKHYDLMHLFLYFINAATRPFKPEDLPFLKKLFERKIPIMFIISRCDSKKQGEDNVKQLKLILRDNITEKYWVTPMNLAGNIKGFKQLFKTLHEIFDLNHKIKNIQEVKQKLKSGNLNGVINCLSTSIFFKSVKNENDLIQRASNQVNDVIAEFTKTEFKYYLFSFLTSHFDFTYDNEVALMLKISECYGETTKSNQIEALLNQWDLIGIMNELTNEKILGLETMEQTFAFTKQISGFEKMDKEIFAVIYYEASPTLINYLSSAFSYLTRFKRYAIGFALLGYKAKTYFQNRILNEIGFTNMIMKSIDYYSSGIEAFEKISNDPRFAEIN